VGPHRAVRPGCLLGWSALESRGIARVGIARVGIARVGIARVGIARLGFGGVSRGVGELRLG
jgi:hypothetical protein